MRLLLTLATLAALTGASPTLAAQIDDRGAIAIAKPAGRLGRFDTAPTPAAANLLPTNPSFSTTRKREWRASNIDARSRLSSDNQK
jgi:hypothetical protein